MEGDEGAMSWVRSIQIPNSHVEPVGASYMMVIGGSMWYVQVPSNDHIHILYPYPIEYHINDTSHSTIG